MPADPAPCPPISVCIVVQDTADRIRTCLESVAWADEIVVLDSGSTDGTQAICREFTEHVYHQPWQGYVAQKNLCVDRARNLWILGLDADESLSPDLVDEIRRELALHHGDADAFRMPRMTRYLGRWIRHGSWYPDRKVRLWRKDRGRWGGEDPHDRVVIEGERIRTLRHPILHSNYRSVSEHVRRIDRFTTIVAEGWRARRRRFRLAAMVFRPFAKFFELYVWKRGFLDGVPGLMIAVHTSYYAFLKQAKLWELERAPASGSVEKQERE
jgi:glycosyltransferase involved in cell wall biosynthesis